MHGRTETAVFCLSAPQRPHFTSSLSFPAVYKLLWQLALPFSSPHNKVTQKAPRWLDFLFKLFPLPLQCSSRGERPTPLCSRSCTGSCRRRSVCSHHAEKILILLHVGHHLLIFLPFLVPQSVLKHRWSVLYLLLSLAEDPRKPSSRVRKRTADCCYFCCLIFFLLVMSCCNDELKCV